MVASLFGRNDIDTPKGDEMVAARYGRELYDYDADPDETVNIANLPENAATHRSPQRAASRWMASCIA